MVLGLTGSYTAESVRKVLKKRTQAVVEEAMVQPDLGADFVVAMEDVLDLYAGPDDPKCPKDNFDETTKQLIAETRTVVPASPGQTEPYDFEYRRSVASLFMFVESQAGWHHVADTDQHTKFDFANQMNRWYFYLCRPDLNMRSRLIHQSRLAHVPQTLRPGLDPVHQQP